MLSNFTIPPWLAWTLAALDALVLARARALGLRRRQIKEEKAKALPPTTIVIHKSDPTDRYWNAYAVTLEDAWRLF